MQQRSSAGSLETGTAHRTRRRMVLPERRENLPAAEGPPECLVVGVGVSSASLPAVRRLVGGLGAELRAALVLVGADTIEGFPEFLSDVRPGAATVITDGLAPCAGSVYLAPAGRTVTISGGIFTLRGSPGGGHGQPIDDFFRSLAQDQGEYAVGLLLAGTGCDGGLGLQAIRAAGGITLVQDAALPGDSVTSPPGAVCWDRRLPPEQMAATLDRLAAHVRDNAAGREVILSDGALEEIHRILRRRGSIDLRHLDREFLKVRMTRRMVLRQMDAAPEYIRRLDEDEEEREELIRDLVTRRSGFFREPAALEALASSFGEVLWGDRAADSPFRVWVPSCSTGEEVYSVAVIALEMLEAAGPRPEIRVFGTDARSRDLDFARLGQYPEWMVREISQARRSRFFSHLGQHCRVKSELRELCVFARHALVDDPPLSRMDLVVCRDQLGVVSPAMQARILSLVHYSLKPNGVLVLGESDSVEAAPGLFAPAGDASGVYLRKENEGRIWFMKPAASRDEPGSLVDAEAKPAVAADAGDSGRSEAGVLRALTLEELTRKAGLHLQALLEEQVQTIEALKLANEEITCSNEELQATNEELTTAREEVQAANQELVSLNEELTSRNAELARTSEELWGLLRNIDLAIVTVDGKLRVRRFNPPAERLFSLQTEDLQRPITDLMPHVPIPDLEFLLKDTTANLNRHEREVRDRKGERYRVCIRPYLSEDRRIDGAIITAVPLGATSR